MPDQPSDDKTRRTTAAEAAAAKPAQAASAAKPAADKPDPAAADKPESDPAAADAAGAKPGPDEGEAGDRAVLRQQWADEARDKTEKHDKKIRTFLLRLSLLNWGIAIVAWTVSAALGITSPASLIVYSVLFVIGLVAAILAILTYLLEKFGHEPSPVGPIAGDEGDGGAGDDVAEDRASPRATPRRPPPPDGALGVPGSGPASKPALFARLVKIEHSVYAFPFAYAGAFLAADGLPTWSQLLWITVAMVGARSAAMALNRLIDAEIDARNPRTASRELPAGRLGRREVWLFTVVSIALLVLASFQLSEPCRYLWPIRWRRSCSTPTRSASPGSATTRWA